ncbi:hypothetical protein GMA11_01595 [Granulicatella sp. zg-ZJ]|uniref:cell wall-active antibiotics response protein LiaF n=1 Tax=Granulicatella sp. zg-ZJ TaxID=2678504 RepID=UPI0013D1B1F9|nr:cell wall-active antibiotics response protein LiaF [Granulicatella sp. zg-ZJ]NEW62079.1 hypothetical protein [Granulicatella sp. zg-ZJ]
MKHKTAKQSLIIAGILLFVVIVLSVMLLFTIVKTVDILTVTLILITTGLGIAFFKYIIGKLTLGVSLALFFVFFLSNPIFFAILILIVAISFFVWKGIVDIIVTRFHQFDRKMVLHVKDKDTQKYGRVQKRNWWTNENRLTQTYEWDDIHLVTWFGDTMIDLGNTYLLENNANIIVIHKGAGDVCIVVPVEIGVVLNHSTLKGNVLFENEEYYLTNEQLTVYSENYTSALRTVKIVTTVYLGNLEVIRV